MILQIVALWWSGLLVPFRVSESGVSGGYLMCFVHLTVVSGPPVFPVHLLQQPTLSHMVHQARFDPCSIKETVWGCCRRVVGWCQQSDRMNVLNPSASSAVTLACRPLSLCSPSPGNVHCWAGPASRQMSTLVCLLNHQSHWNSGLSPKAALWDVLLLSRTSSLTLCLPLICLWGSSWLIGCAFSALQPIRFGYWACKHTGVGGYFLSLKCRSHFGEAPVPACVACMVCQGRSCFAGRPIE